MLTNVIPDTGRFLLLAFPALFSIINPLGGAFIFLAATRGMEQTARSRMARQVATYSFITLNVSMLIGAFVLRIFGIEMPVLRLAGGIVIALTAWKLLNAEDDSSMRGAVLEEAGGADASHLAFYPLTMPMTTGPGTIAVAIALGTIRALTERVSPRAFRPGEGGAAQALDEACLRRPGHAQGPQVRSGKY